VSTLTLYTVKNKLPSTQATLKQKQDEYDAIAKQKKIIKPVGTNNTPVWS
jgi:hypothetical protein